jgi:integrase
VPLEDGIEFTDRPSKIAAHAVLPEPAATVFAVAPFTGARRGEVGGLVWENYTAEAIHIAQAVWHGHVTEPKTRKSKGAIPVIAPLAKRLESHRARTGNPTSGPMFPNEAGKPTDLNNLLNRVILPTLNRCVHCGGHAVRTCCRSQIEA